MSIHVPHRMETGQCARTSDTGNQSASALCTGAMISRSAHPATVGLASPRVIAPACRTSGRRAAKGRRKDRPGWPSVAEQRRRRDRRPGSGRRPRRVLQGNQRPSAAGIRRPGTGRPRPSQAQSCRRDEHLDASVGPVVQPPRHGLDGRHLGLGHRGVREAWLHLPEPGATALIIHRSTVVGIDQREVPEFAALIEVRNAGDTS